MDIADTGSGGEPHLDVDLDIQELSTLLDMTQLKGLAAIIGRTSRIDLVLYAVNLDGAQKALNGMAKRPDIKAAQHPPALSLVFFELGVPQMKSRCAGLLLFAMLSLRGSVDQMRVEVLQVSLPLLECLAIRREAYIELATRKQKESYFQKKRCCRRRSADDPTEALGEGADDEEDFDGLLDLVDGSLRLSKIRMWDFDLDDDSDESEEDDLGRSITMQEIREEKDIRLVLTRCFWIPVPFFANAIAGKFYFDLLYPPGANGRRMLHVQSMGVRGAPYRLHKHPAFSLQVTEASAVFSAAPKEGPELRSFLAFDRKRMSTFHAGPEKFEKAGQDKMRPVFQLRALAREEEMPATTWRRHQIHPSTLEYQPGVTVITIGKPMVRRGPLANGQRFYGSVIFPGGFSVMVLDLYHESRLLLEAPTFTDLAGLWLFSATMDMSKYVAIQAKEGAEAAQTDGDWEADGFEIEESPFADATPPKKPEVKENVLLSCAAQVAGPAALFAASMAAEAGRSAAARMTAAIPIPACSEALSSLLD
ncbi:hypothetical protein AK812_SmicGene13947 [Symbiodinium microadriaticum]|uniref:Uncharacterized protein n=1 Tax=Symbiodinium microadriaticum TaxID=2951 RepID=A0A1Q9E6S3_SYMMI|nr:hypothetical protein AK812_SmicGene13947 [Symbiodinium microadriaticum]